MPARKLGVIARLPRDLSRGLAEIRAELDVPADFTAEQHAAARAAAAAVRLPELDRADLPLLTIDPPGARDLDQALHLAADGDGFVLSYAIADVAAFVEPGGLLDQEAHRRGMTLYAPDHRTPLHPPVLSEGAASLLPHRRRPALLWTITLDGQGQMQSAQVTRATVESRAQLTYAEAQESIDGQSAAVGQASALDPPLQESLRLLAIVGRLREECERQRGGVSLQIPEQEIQVDDGDWVLTYRSALPVEGWNAQLSLLTGMAAAQLMLQGRVGVLRTLPAADDGSLHHLRRQAQALHIDWPADLGYPDFVRSLDPHRPDHAAMLLACTSLFRGAGYHSFNGSLPDQVIHAALAVEYAHATAPLRRLADRYVGEICLALCAGQQVPDWAAAALEELPQEMQAAESRAKKYERAILNLAEAHLMAGHLGETFTGTVVELDNDSKGTVMLTSPAVEASLRGDHLQLGSELSVRLVAADAEKRQLLFEPV